MARRKRRRSSLGFVAGEHRGRGVRAMKQARTEAKVIRQHLRAGECAAAVRGVTALGWALGRAAAEREGAESYRQSGEGATIRTFHDARRLAGEVIRVCKVPNKKRRA